MCSSDLGGRLHKPEDEVTTRPNPNDKYPKSNPMTGPVGITGAKPGDSLAVEIVSIEVDPVGYVGVFPEVGIVRDVVNQRTVTMLPVKDGQVHFNDLRLPLKPMIGAMACAPLEPISVGLIGKHGGNMDNNRLAVGTTVHLPIYAPLGLFYVGDVHATMGDAEMCGSGAEIGARVHLRFKLEKGGATEWPWMETHDRWITTASAPTFEDAAEFSLGFRLSLDKQQEFAGELLARLVRRGVIPAPLAGQMLGWRHSGFTVHNAVRVAASDAQGRRSLAAYMLRAPFSLEKTSYDAASGTVIYRSRLHATLKRNFQLMPGVQWLELLCKHIPDRHEHLVRYYGRYSSRTRGAERERPGIDEPEAEPTGPSRKAAKAAWAKLIRKVYEVDPLLCPQCGTQMRVIALIEDPAVIERILSWLGPWEPLRPGGPSPPAGARGLPLTYHPLPEIA